MAKKANVPKKAALKSSEAVATIGVRNLEAARQFYENMLGLEPEEVGDQVVTYSAADSRLFVYKTEFAGTNRATAATWVTDDVDGIAADLKARGVRFERYSFPDMKLEGDVHVSGAMRSAWFKDPDGNILAVVSG